jgi:hypothetical protein
MLFCCSQIDSCVEVEQYTERCATACSQCFGNAPRPPQKCKNDLEAALPLQAPRQQQPLDSTWTTSGVPIQQLKQPKRKLTSHSAGLVVRTSTTGSSQDQQDSESSKMLPGNTPQRHMHGSFSKPNMPLIVVGETVQQSAEDVAS